MARSPSVELVYLYRGTGCSARARRPPAHGPRAPANLDSNNVIIACASVRREKRRRRAAKSAVQSRLAVFLGFAPTECVIYGIGTEFIWNYFGQISTRVVWRLARGGASVSQPCPGGSPKTSPRGGNRARAGRPHWAFGAHVRISVCA